MSAHNFDDVSAQADREVIVDSSREIVITRDHTVLVLDPDLAVTIAPPTSAGLRLQLCCVGTGNPTTVDFADIIQVPAIAEVFDQIEFDASDQSAMLVSVATATGYAWKLVYIDGATVVDTA